MFCNQVQRVILNQFQGRIFGFASHAQTTSLHVRKNIFHDFSKVSCTQWMVAEIVTIAPKNEKQKTLLFSIELYSTRFL